MIVKPRAAHVSPAGEVDAHDPEGRRQNPLGLAVPGRYDVRYSCTPLALLGAATSS